MNATPRILGRGYNRDAAEKLAAKRPATEHPAIAARLLGGRGTVNGRPMLGLAGKADLSSFSPPIFDQGDTGSCTAHSSSGAIVTAFAAAHAAAVKQQSAANALTHAAKVASESNKALEHMTRLNHSTSVDGHKARVADARGALPFIPSPKAIYAATRAWTRGRAIAKGDALPALADTGAELADVASALAQYGVAPLGPFVEDRQSDVDPANVNDEPDILALAEAAKQLVTGEYIVDPTSANASDVCAAALESGLPIWVGFFCDSDFENLQPGQIAGVPDESDPQGGGHAVYLSGYTKTATGRVWTLTNSWGTGWCNQGRCLVSDAWLAKTWALYPMAVAPVNSTQEDA